MDVPLTCRSLPGCLEQDFPAYQAAIWAVRVRNHPVVVTADMVVAEVFVDEIFLTGVSTGDREMLGRWFGVVERALGGPDEMLQKFFVDHVVPVVLNTDRRARWTQELAGTLLRARLDAVVGVPWRRQVGGFGPEYEETLGVPLIVSGYVYRDEILLHSARQRRDRTAVPMTRPFARLPARSDAYRVGATVAEMLTILPRTLDEDPRHAVDEFLSYAGIAEWAPFYAESLTVNLQGGADTYALSIWPMHKDRGGTHQGESSSVPDWRDAADLGTAVLTAFRTATVNGRTL
ncbi:hypothetical protein [Kribbella ginsengisoli]|uniref:Uncharacterized protein n=1 Tax=Kribbella ginsengisoli TaxID=363865 RepID=A0ABP6VY46_9ACTN